MNNINVLTYKGLTREELRNVFDSLNIYGMESLASVIEAWQYEYEEDGTILKEVFDSVKEEKERNLSNRDRNPISDREELRRSLSALSDKEFDFIGDLLELDPDEVFMHNPMEEYYGVEYVEDACEEEYDEEPYIIFKGIYSDLAEERVVKKFINSKPTKGAKLMKESEALFNQRFNKSLETAKKEKMAPKDPFTKRYTKSLTAQKKKDGFRPYSL